VETINGRLHIGLKDDLSINGNETLEAYVTADSLTYFKIGAESQVKIENTLDQENTEFCLSGESKLEGSIEVEKVIVSLSGESQLDLSGAAGQVVATLTGESQLQDYGLTVTDLLIDMSGESKTYLTVDGTIDVKASGDSMLHYKGDGVISNQELSGDSKIKQED